MRVVAGFGHSSFTAQDAGAIEGDRSVDHGHDHLAREDLCGISLEEIAVEDGQIGAIAGLEYAQAIFREACVRCTRGEAAEGLFERELLFGMPPAFGFAVGLLPGDSGVDSPERVDDLDGKVAAVGQCDSRLRKPSPGVGAVRPGRARASRRPSAGRRWRGKAASRRSRPARRNARRPASARPGRARSAAAGRGPRAQPFARPRRRPAPERCPCRRSRACRLASRSASAAVVIASRSWGSINMQPRVVRIIVVRLEQEGASRAHRAVDEELDRPAARTARSRATPEAAGRRSASVAAG